MYQMVSALFELHTHNIIHRDLKSDNIFIGMDGNFKLGDYGVGKALDNDDGLTSTFV
jgi:serine/threonine protein kinase